MKIEKENAIQNVARNCRNEMLTTKCMDKRTKIINKWLYKLEGWKISKTQLQVRIYQLTKQDS